MGGDCGFFVWWVFFSFFLEFRSFFFSCRFFIFLVYDFGFNLLLILRLLTAGSVDLDVFSRDSICLRVFVLLFLVFFEIVWLIVELGLWWLGLVFLISFFLVLVYVIVFFVIVVVYFIVLDGEGLISRIFLVLVVFVFRDDIRVISFILEIWEVVGEVEGEKVELVFVKGSFIRWEFYRVSVRFREKIRGYCKS